jgi:hypothetical protein
MTANLTNVPTNARATARPVPLPRVLDPTAPRHRPASPAGVLDPDNPRPRLEPLAGILNLDHPPHRPEPPAGVLDSDYPRPCPEPPVGILDLDHPPHRPEPPAGGGSTISPSQRVDSAPPPAAGAGRRLVTADIYQARRQICHRCPWRLERSAHAPAPHCDHPRRPCAHLHPWRAEETCPAGHWPRPGHLTPSQ